MVDFRSLLANNSNALLQAGTGLLSGQTPQQQVAMGAQGFMQGRQRNQTMDWLAKNYPDLAQGVQMGAISPADAFKTAWETRTKTTSPKDNLMSVGKSIYNAETGQWISPPPGMDTGGDNYYGTVIKGYDPSGNPIYLQPGKNGVPNQIKLPEGFKPENRIDKIDLGDSWLIRDNTNGSSQVLPKNLAGAEAQKAIGKGAGEAALQIPMAQQMAQEIDKQVKDLSSNPNLDKVLGWLDSKTPNISEGAVDAQSKIDQISGGAFLQARQMLKGGGAITDYEGQKAEEAFVRMNQAQSKKDFVAALNDFNYFVQNGLAKLKQQAGMAGAGPSQGAPMPTGQTGSGVQWSIEQ